MFRITWARRLAIITTACFVGFEAPAFAADDTEPPQLFYIEAGGQRVPIELNKAFPTSALGKIDKATLRVEPYREFDFGGVQFRYPREYTFEADLSTAGVKMWTLSGNDCVMMVHRYSGQDDLKAFERVFVNQLKSVYEKCSESESSLKLNDRTLTGIKLDATAAGQHLVQELFFKKVGDDVILLVLQDSLNDEDETSKDRATVGAMLGSTLKLPTK